jgi:hypothetical protein
MRKMKKILKTGILLFGISILLMTCKKDTIENPKPDLDLMFQAKTYFETEVISSTEKELFPSVSKVKVNLRQFLSKRARWDKAYTRNISIGQAVIVPLSYDKSIFLKVGKNNQTVNVDNLSYLMIFKTPKGKMTAELVTWIPDDTFWDKPNNKNKKYSGKILVETWYGKFIKGYSYENDGSIKSIEIKDTDVRENRTSNVSCSTINWYSCVSVDGGQNFNCEYDYSETTCYVSYESGGTGLGGNNGNSNEEMFNGGGGGGSPGDYLPDLTNPVQDPNLIPCPGDPIKNPTIAPTAKGKTGGRYGYTRFGGTKFHDGLDIQAALGSKIYAPFDGIVIDTRSSFAPNEYRKDSYGNYVSIKFTLQNGQIIILKYNHLNSVNVTNGSITTGSLIGTSGITGNAKDVIPHVHIQARNIINNKEVWTNPEQYLATKFDSQGNPINQPCQ